MRWQLSRLFGDWLDGSGWTQALVQVEIGMADSLLKSSHVMRTRKAHQITAAALYTLQHRAFDHYRLACSNDNQTPVSLESWSNERTQNCPQFQFWAIVMELELCILTYVRSLRESNFAIDASTELVPWFFALDHTNYACWVPVHLRDMAELPKTHPNTYREFNAGHFTVQKEDQANFLFNSN